MKKNAIKEESKNLNSLDLIEEKIEPFFRGIAHKYKPKKCKLYLSHSVSSDLGLRALDTIFKNIKENRPLFPETLSKGLCVEYSYDCQHADPDEVGGAVNQLSTIHFWMETIRPSAKERVKAHV